MGLESLFKLSLIMNMVDNLTGPMAKVTSSTGGAVSKLQAANSVMGSMITTGSAMATMGESITSAVLAPVAATFETRQAIGELSSLGVKDLAAIESAALNFSNTWTGTTKADFITAAYDIKSGIASLTDEGIGQFTELAGLTALATKSTTEEMGSLFATGYGIYKGYYDDLTDLQFGEIFSAGISTAVRAYKTSGSEMAASISRLGAAATNANVPIEEQLAILGMLQTTMAGSEAGTKYAAFIRSAARGGDALGLSFLDANNQLKSLPEILDQLKGKFGETIDATEKLKLQEAFGDQLSIQFIDLMYSKTDDLQNGILEMYSALGSGIGVTEEMANAINRMEPAKYEVLRQRIQNVKESIGNSLLPTINDALGAGANVAEKVGSWVERNQSLVRVLMIIALTLGGTLTVLGTFIAVVGGTGLIITKTIATLGLLKNGFLIVRGVLTPLMGAVWRFAGVMLGMLRTGLLMAKAAIMPLISAMWSFTAALLANPVTWAVIGIVGLITVIYLLWTRCEWFRDGVISIVGTIQEKVGAGINFVKGLPAAFGTAVLIGLDLAKNAVTEKLNGMKMAITDKYQEFKDSGAKLITTFTDGIKSAISAPVEAVRGGLQNIRNMLPFSDAKTGPLSTLTLSGQRTMTTYADGLLMQRDAPSAAMERGLERTSAVLERSPLSTTDNTRKDYSDSDGDGESNSSRRKNVVIQKFIMSVDLKKIRELQQLLDLLQQIEDYTISNGDDGDPTTEFLPV